MKADHKYYSGLLLALLFSILLSISDRSGFQDARRESPSETAFFNVRWGMTQHEAEISGGRKLYTVANAGKFYSVKPGILISRYKALQEEPGRLLLGREAEVTYIFFDDHLFSYHVFVHDRDPDVLDHDMKNLLFKKYGQSFIVEENNNPMTMIWNQKDIIVNYWFYKDSFSLGEKYIAGYGVLYRPIERTISN